MTELSIDAVAVAVLEHTNYLPLTNFPADLLPQRRMPAGPAAIPRERLMVLAPEDSMDMNGPDVSALALAALGVPEHEQPLFLVRSGPPRDTLVAPLARLVHEAGWTGEDLGITHLDELGGTVVFDLLDWAVPDETGATVLICDEPLFVDARLGAAQFSAVSMQLRRGPGPLRVRGCGEGAPGLRPDAGERLFTGSGPCDTWLALHGALAAGEIADGDCLLLHTRGPLREGWLSMCAVDTAGLRLADGVERLATGAGGRVR